MHRSPPHCIFEKRKHFLFVSFSLRFYYTTKISFVNTFFKKSCKKIFDGIDSFLRLFYCCMIGIVFCTVVPRRSFFCRRVAPFISSARILPPRKTVIVPARCLCRRKNKRFRIYAIDFSRRKYRSSAPGFFQIPSVRLSRIFLRFQHRFFGFVGRGDFRYGLRGR